MTDFGHVLFSEDNVQICRTDIVFGKVLTMVMRRSDRSLRRACHVTSVSAAFTVRTQHGYSTTGVVDVS